VRLACSTSTFPQDRLEIAVAKVNWAGYEEIELFLDREPLPPEEAVREKLRVDGLDLAAVHAGTLPSAAGDAALPQLARIGRAAAFARALDGGMVIVAAPPEGTLRELAQLLGTLDLALGGLAVDICLVNRAGTLLAAPDYMNELWQAGLERRFGLAVDPGQAILAGWDPLDLDALPELPRYVYLNDAGPRGIAPPGEGLLDPGALGEALRLRGYGGSVCLALENADPWAVEPIAREIREAAQGWFG
jgi:sugar phosphate isomerase/epimerase